MAWITFVIGIYVIAIITLPCFCGQIKLFQTNLRMSSKSVTRTTRSLLECSAVFVNDQQSLSFNYNYVDKICELSEDYPEQSSTTTEGWNVYAPTVNGEWSVWRNLGSCTAACGDGTRTRTRLCNNPPASNGGIQCPGDSTHTESCNNGRCLSANGYYISTDKSKWEDAKVACEGVSAQLVIINDQKEQDFLEDLTGGMEHWIGMKCSNPLECSWIDGTPSENGFTVWYPGEPSGTGCVWTGYRGPFWDDVSCDTHLYFICEYL